MRERLYYDVEGKRKKEIIEALKNEQKLSKKISIFNSNDEEIATVVKWDDYFSYIDFWLDDFIEDSAVNKNGQIVSIETEHFEKKPGNSIIRIKKIKA